MYAVSMINIFEQCVVICIYKQARCTRMYVSCVKFAAESLLTVFPAGRIPFAYLEDIHMRFMKTYGRVANSALAYAMNDEFSRVLHQQMEYFSSNPNADAINRVKGEIAEVCQITILAEFARVLP